MFGVAAVVGDCYLLLLVLLRVVVSPVVCEAFLPIQVANVVGPFHNSKARIGAFAVVVVAQPHDRYRQQQQQQQQQHHHRQHVLGFMVRSTMTMVSGNNNNNNNHNHNNRMVQTTTTTNDDDDDDDTMASTSSLRAIQAKNLTNKTQQQQPHHHHHHDVYVILPAYNEVLRIGPTIHDYMEYLTHHESIHCPMILVVDDGSTDGTCDFVHQIQQKQQALNYPKLKCISLPTNQGKGAAVAHGISFLVENIETINNNSNNKNVKEEDEAAGAAAAAASVAGNEGEREGCLVLIADADGSASIDCLDEMIHTLLLATQHAHPSATTAATAAASVARSSSTTTNTSTCRSIPAMVVGKRNSPKTSVLRSILRWGFRTTVTLLAGNVGVSDTQCGFKLYTMTAAQVLYQDLHLRRWTHDVEVLYRAHACWNIPVHECPIDWKDRDGSKLVQGWGGAAVAISIIMLLEVMQMRFAYELGIWKFSTMDSTPQSDWKR